MSASGSLVLERWNNRNLWRLLWPLTLEQLLSVAVGMVATVMVTAVGESAVSGVSLVDNINILMINIFAAFATGGAVVISRFLGRDDTKSASAAARQLVYGISIVSVVLMLIPLVAGRPLLQLIYGQVDAEVMQAAQTYFFYSALSFPFIALYNAGAAIFRSMGNSRVSMLIALLMNVVNIGAGMLFIYGAGWGVTGAAIATLISRALAAVVILWLLVQRKHIQPVSLIGLRRVSFDKSLQRGILRIGVPNGLENSIFQIGKLLVSRIVADFGREAIAGNAISNVVATFCTLAASAVGLGLLTVVGQCIGAGDISAARRYTKKMVGIAWIAMIVSSVVVFAVSKPLLSIFNLSAEAQQLAWTFVAVHCAIGALCWAPSFALPSALRAAGDARFTMLVAIFSMWTFRVGLAYLFAYTLNWGVIGVWLAMSVDWMVRSVLFLLRQRGKRWEPKTAG